MSVRNHPDNKQNYGVIQMNRRTKKLVTASVIAALYAVLTILSSIFGLAYGGVQFRISEVLCVLPLFTSSAIPGLTVGCILSNVFSTINPVDMLVGSLATLLAGICTRMCRNIKIKNFPFLSMTFPVLFNAVFVGAEIAFFSGENVFLPAFALNAVSVGIGEAAVIFTLGTALVLFIGKNDRLKRFISD